MIFRDESNGNDIGILSSFIVPTHISLITGYSHAKQNLRFIQPIQHHVLCHMHKFN
jgi:hypothetical protein